jgi:hypothetical protein
VSSRRRQPDELPEELFAGLDPAQREDREALLDCCSSATWASISFAKRPGKADCPCFQPSWC